MMFTHMLPYLNPVAYWHFVMKNVSNWGYGKTPQDKLFLLQKTLLARMRHFHIFSDWSHNDTRTISTELICKVDVEYNLHGHLTLVQCDCVSALCYFLRSESGRL